MPRFPSIAAVTLLSMSTVTAFADSKKSRSQIELWNIDLALRAYKAHYGDYPAGKSLDVIKTLSGKNPKRIEFLDWNGRFCATDANGRLRDEWGTPYLISSSRDSYAIRSAGPDRQFHTADDRFIERSPSVTNIHTLH
jgi:hypothetical protein